MICPLHFFTGGSFCVFVVKGFFFWWAFFGPYVHKWVVDFLIIKKGVVERNFGVFSVKRPFGVSWFLLFYLLNFSNFCIFFSFKFPLPSRSACHSGVVVLALSGLDLFSSKLSSTPDLECLSELSGQCLYPPTPHSPWPSWEYVIINVYHSFVNFTDSWLVDVVIAIGVFAWAVVCLIDWAVSCGSLVVGSSFLWEFSIVGSWCDYTVSRVPIFRM